ncbi:MAG: molybdopterin converting factor subunit 1 [Deltaproteobacteria bacterium]|nr:molybdopterin converting factor subunit 1 [Deltaproteobacteria bacterium]
MRGRVKLFASLREAAGRSEMDWDLSEGATVGTLLTHLQKSIPGFDEWSDRAWIAVNKCYATLDTSLQEGDEVAMFPPVSGG